VEDGGAEEKNDIKMGLEEINWKAVNWINGSGCRQ
jgi:hypothetical protein